MNPHERFQVECREEIRKQGEDASIRGATREWMNQVNLCNYSYHFSWLGRPVIQYPQDLMAMQELIWRVRPDLIIETGIAHGGSLIFSASMLALLDMADAEAHGGVVDVRRSKRLALGVDIDIRAHNREALEAHPLRSRFEMIEGSSVDSQVVERVREIAAKHERVLVCLDSMHTHAHVLAELEAYAPLVSPGSYCVVFDTIIEHFPPEGLPERPWAKGNNPLTAIAEYLEHLRLDGRRAADGELLHYEVDADIERKLLITVAPGGYLKRC